MGLGPPILALYRQMQVLGAFEGVHDVIELGAQTVVCPRRRLIVSLFEAFERPVPPEGMIDRFAHGSARELYEALGFDYHCIDLDPNFKSLRVDLNFDGVPAGHVGRYDLVTNHGTSEHVLNQYNCFKVMHELCRNGGLLINAVPFTGYMEHGFFNYQPNFFSALARYNSYDTLGLWIGLDWQLSSLVPWEHDMMGHLAMDSKKTHLLVVLQRKVSDQAFSVPLQEVYEALVPEQTLTRYSVGADGAGLDRYRGTDLAAVPGRQMLQELYRRVSNRIQGGFDDFTARRGGK